MLRYSCLLLVLCALSQSQALKVVARAALPIPEDADDAEGPPAEGRFISIIRDSDRDHRYHDDRPIIIQAPPQQYPQYPQHPQHPPYQPYPQYPPQYPPQLYPYPVPAPAPAPIPPPTIIKPIIRLPYPYPYPPQYPNQSPGSNGNSENSSSSSSSPTNISFNYHPALAGAIAGVAVASARVTPEQQQLNDLTRFSQLLSQGSGGQPQLLRLPIQLTVSPNYRSYQTEPQQYYSRSSDQLFAINLDDQQQQFDEVEPIQLQQKRQRTQYVVRRNQKSNKRSKKNKKQTQLVYFDVTPEAEAQAQSPFEEVA